MFRYGGIVGVGLIGGSLALDLKKHRLAECIVGFDKSSHNLSEALNLKIIDKIGNEEDLKRCDFVVVATPVDVVAENLLWVFDNAEKAIVIDVGSVKGVIVDRVKPFVKNNFYVPTHPIAGTERFGPQAAFEGLFKDAHLIITPYEGMDRKAAETVKNLAGKLGMKVEFMDAHLHDIVFGYVSHLPHAIAYALVDLVSKKDHNYTFIGGGFKDYTRIAASSEDMWSAIFSMNKDNLKKAVEEFKYYLNKIVELAEKPDELKQHLKQVRLFKENYLEK